MQSAEAIAARVRVMDAEHLDLPDASFDRVLCGFGIMFPQIRLGRCSEVRRVLRPAGRVGLSTWKEPESYDLTVVLQRLGHTFMQSPVGSRNQTSCPIC